MTTRRELNDAFECGYEAAKELFFDLRVTYGALPHSEQQRVSLPMVEDTKAWAKFVQLRKDAKS